MEKPVWRVRSSSYVIDSPFMRLRKDDVELPNGTVLPEYFVRESAGFVMVFALTNSDDVVLIRQYRYGSDSVILELPAGSIEWGEDPLTCAQRELVEETGYEAPVWHLLVSAQTEPARSTALMYSYLALDAVRIGDQQLDASEQIDVELLPLSAIGKVLREGELNSIACLATAYAALDFLASRK